MQLENNLRVLRTPTLIITLLVTILSTIGLAKLSAQTDYQTYQKAVINAKHLLGQGDLENALVQGELAYKVASARNDKKGKATALHLQSKALIRMTKRQTKNRKKATSLLEESLQYLSPSGDISMKREAYEMLKSIAAKDGNTANVLLYDQKLKKLGSDNALKAEKKALEAQKAKLEKNSRALENKLDEMSEDVEELETKKTESDSMLQVQMEVSDSLYSKLAFDSMLLVQKEMALSEKNAKLELQQSQIDLAASQKKFSYAIAGLALLLLFGMLLRYFDTKKNNAVLQAKNEMIVAEKKRSENLLLNILPSLVADELRDKGAASAKSYKHASVLFTDFIAFSKVAETLKPEELVNVLDYYFKGFDEILTRHKVEKIKTIGDAYMVVAGLPEEDPNNPYEMVRFGIAIQQFMEESKVIRAEKGLPYFDARVGIHTGPLVAGVVGNKKFAYDVWGDTVNVAARVESHCGPGRVNISKSTYEAVKDEYFCEYRGEVAVKNRGDVGMYYLDQKYKQLS